MTILYAVLHNSAADHPQCVKGPVHAVEHKGAGRACHYFDGAGMVEPDYAAVRECLPHYWRKAWDRRGGVWFVDEAGATGDVRRPASVTLYGSRKRYLATIYLQPYRFSPSV